MNASGQTFEVNSWLANDPVSPRPLPVFAEEVSSPWLIIGAGFTGVAAAFEIARQRPDDPVVLVDAAPPGQGNSERSSGFAVSIGQFSGPYRDLALQHQLGLAGIQRLRDQVRMFDIDCQWNETGRLIGARGIPGVRSLAQTRRCLQMVDSPCTQIDPAEVTEKTGMQGYLRCIQQHDSVMVNPARLLGGLIKNLPDNVKVLRATGIQDLQRRDCWIARTPTGLIRSPNVLITNNGFAPSLVGVNHRIFALRTFVSVFSSATGCFGGTDPNWGITSVERVGSSLRKVDDRVFVRSGALLVARGSRQSARELQEMSQLHSAAFQSRFPHVQSVVENTWSGVIGVSANGRQVFGALKPGLWASCGYNGHGISQGTVAGKLLAQLAMGQSNPELAAIQKIATPNWIPSGSILNMGVHVLLKYLGWRYSAEI